MPKPRRVHGLTLDHINPEQPKEHLDERNKTIERQFSNAGTNFLTRDNLISLAERVMMMIFGRQFDFIG